MAAPPSDPAMAVRAGRVLAIRHAPYLASALLRMVLIETDQVPTMGVDKRWRLYVNPEFAASRSVEELTYVWLHEVGHCLRAHPKRWEAVGEPDRLHGLFNIAGDALINADLDDIVPNRPADRVVIDRLGVSGAHRGMSVEQLFRLLLDADQLGEGGNSGENDAEGPADCGSGAGGGARPWELPDSDDDGSVDEGSADLIRDAVAHDIRARAAIGNVPGGFVRWAEDRLEPVVDWHRELRTVLTKELSQQAGRRDYTYARPGRRRVPGVVLPAMVAPAPPAVAVVIDTSGSMRADDLGRALAETGELIRRVGRSRRPLRVVACDRAAREAAVVRSIDQVELVGGGGTDMGDGIRAASELAPRVNLIVVITDGLTGWPERPPRPGLSVVAVLTRPETIERVPQWIRTVEASSGSAAAA